jgi:tetratricopeptide (TPR) repeat protein
MHSRLMSWSRYALLAGIVLALVLVIPTAWFPFQLSKVAALSLGLLVSAVLFVAGGGARELPRAHGFYMALAVGLLPLFYLISTLRSPDRWLSITGFGVETDTVLFTLLLALVFLMSFALFRTLRTARMLSQVVFWALIAAAVFQLISIFFGSALIPFQTFADRSVNLVGKWNDLGLLVGLLAIFLIVRVELAAASTLWRVAAGVGGAFLVVLLAFVNFPLAWVLVLSGCVIIAVLSMLRRRAEGRADTPAEASAMVPWYSTAGVILSILFLLFGANINASLTSMFPVSSLEVRPGVQATLDVISKARAGSVADMLVGQGPNTFSSSWLAHKPAEVNRTPFWNLDFNVGYSTLLTAFGSVGLVGALLWLTPLILLVLALVRVVRLNVLSREERQTVSVLGLGSLFMLAAVVLYVPSPNLILLTFALAGATFGFLWRQGRAAEDELVPATMLGGLSVLAIAGVLLIVTTLTTFTTIRRAAAQAYVGAGAYALSQGRIDDALAHSASAARIEPVADALRLATDAGLQKLAAIAQDTSVPQEEARNRFTAQVQSTLPIGQAAIAAAPLDYRSYFALARVYDFLASLQVDGAYESAVASYTAAAERNPTTPVIPLALSRLEASQGNAAGTQTNITRALELKPDYTDAILFVVQINVANNDLRSAIQNTQVAVQTAPGVASIWFQLGLLYYAGGDSKNAIPPLEQALKLVPNYANAKYFLGLAYYVDGRQNDSLRMFEELALSNPESQEVKTILANLRAGKQPLEGLTPPPEDRPTAPINQ